MTNETLQKRSRPGYIRVSLETERRPILYGNLRGGGRVVNLRGLDLNLVTVFEAVYEAGSISRAADRLALSQSATSHALARLRDACRDELFVRSAAGIAPTPVAQLMYPEVRKALDGLRRSLAEAQGFDPSSSTRRFRVAIPHPAGPIWGLAIADKAKAAAPGVAIEFNTRTMPIDPTGRMLAGDLDLSVDWLPGGRRSFCQPQAFYRRTRICRTSGPSSSHPETSMRPRCERSASSPSTRERSSAQTISRRSVGLISTSTSRSSSTRRLRYPTSFCKPTSSVLSRAASSEIMEPRFRSKLRQPPFGRSRYRSFWSGTSRGERIRGMSGCGRSLPKR